MNSWEAESMQIIRNVLKDNEHSTESELKQALKDAYPFGERKHWPYKIWLDCVKRALAGRRLSETKPENSLL